LPLQVFSQRNFVAGFIQLKLSFIQKRKSSLFEPPFGRLRGRDAYAMSHLSAEACTQRLAAGRGDGYQVTGIILQQQQLARSPVHLVHIAYKTVHDQTYPQVPQQLNDTEYTKNAADVVKTLILLTSSIDKNPSHAGRAYKRREIITA